MQINDLKNKLREGLVTVTFKKVNGDLRVMKCTLSRDVIPADLSPKGKVSISEDSKTIRVYDVTAKGWRSFLFENITEISV